MRFLATSTDWIPAVVTLTVGLAGAFAVWFFSRSKPVPTVDRELDPEWRELIARRDALIRQLRELALDPSAEVLAERKRLEVEAAETLRRLDEHARAHPGSPELSPEGVQRKAHSRATMTGFLWGAGSTACIGLLIYFVASATQDRKEGTELTGSVPSQERMEASDSIVSQLQAELARNPADLTLRLDLAKAHLMRNELMQVFEQTQRVLATDPDNARAMSYEALVRLAMGEAEAAEKMLQRAIVKDPALMDGWIHLALVYMRMGKADQAKKTIQDAARKNPDQRPMLESFLAELKAQAAAPASSTPAESSAAASSGSIRGIIEVDPARKIAGGVIFITVRPQGVTSGAPIAAKRIPVSSFPVVFEITASDSMMGMPLPQRMRVEARVDADGVPTTRDPSDPGAAADDVALGENALRLLLR